jgi:ribonuclease J
MAYRNRRSVELPFAIYFIVNSIFLMIQRTKYSHKGTRSTTHKRPPRSRIRTLDEIGEKARYSRNTTPNKTASRFSSRTHGPQRTNSRSPHTHRKTTRSRALEQRPSSVTNGTNDIIPPLEKGSIRIIPLGGTEEIGRNMTLVEYGEDIIVIDCGFQFKEDETPGIDYILPNTKYLEDNKHRVKALLITHGHLDHIGGIPYIMPRIGNPPIYTRKLTAIMIEKRQAEFPQEAKLDMRIVEKEDTVKIGELPIRFFAVTHTIPDSMGILIDTPFGSVMTPGDYKLDHMDNVPTEAEKKEYARFKNENILFMFADSTNVENPGFSTPESIVHNNLDEIIKNHKGRLIIGTFSSQLSRIIAIIKSAEKYDKKIAVEGRSMKTNIEIAEIAGLYTPKKGTLIPTTDIGRYPADKIVVLATGAQGEEFAALMRMANKTHKSIQIQEEDTILLSSSIIPGNERAVEKLKDNLARAGAHIMHYRTSEVYIHSTGHGNKGELEWLHKTVTPTFFMPVHGNLYRLKLHAELAASVGMQKDHIVIPENGAIVEIYDEGKKISVRKEKAASNIRMVDGFAVGDIQEIVIRDRQQLAQDGMFVIIAMIHLKTGKLRKSPDIISRGFVYLRESQELLAQTRLIAKKSAEEAAAGMNPINFEYVKKNMTDSVGSFLFQKTNKHPIVIPVVLGV